MFKPSESLTLGATYRSRIDLEVEGGEADFENAPFPDTTFGASLPLPAELGVGVSYKFCEKWLVTGEFTRSYWGVYESLDIDFANPIIDDSENPRNYNNTTTWRLGAQYDHNEKFTFRAGYYFDESPVASGYFSPETPRNDSHGFTTGLTYRINDKFEVDASFLYLYFDEISESYNSEEFPAFEGSYVTNVFTPGIGVTYKL